MSTNFVVTLGQDIATLDFQRLSVIPLLPTTKSGGIRKFLSSCLVIAEDAFEIADPAVAQALRPFVDRLATHMGEVTTVRLAPEGLAAWSDQLLLVMSLVQRYAALTYLSLCHKTGSLLCGRSGQANASW